MTAPLTMAGDALAGDAAPVAPETPERSSLAPSGTALEGALLVEQDEAKVMRRLEYFWSVDDTRMDRRKARWRRVKYWRSGIRNVYLTQSDTGDVEVYAPPTQAILPPVPNLVDRLCRRVTAQLLADPMQPDVVPVNGDEEHEAHAEFATKLLRVEHSESGTNFRAKLEALSDMAHTFASSFAYATVDPKGGGWEPMDVQAHPNATTLAEVEAGGDPQPPTIPQPMVDPMTGQPMLGPDGQPMQQQAPNPQYLGDSAPPVRRYVMPDGTLSDRQAGAKRRWLPRNHWCLLPAVNVRFVPHTTVGGLNEAQGVVLCVPSTLGELKAKFPAVAQFKPDELRAMVEYRPPKFADLKKLQDQPAPKASTSSSEKGEPEDDAVCYPLTFYHRASAAYPKGAYIVGVGKHVLHRQAWSVTTDDGTEELLDIPLSQCRDFDATAEGDPYGSALGEYLGPLDEIHAQAWAFLLEYMLRHGNPNVYLPSTSPVQPEQLRRRDGTAIPVTSKEDMPFYEPIPPLPPALADMAGRIAAELNSESGLEQAAQGVASPSVSSGIHAEQIIEQALVALGQMKRNLDDCAVRMWRVDLQLKRAFWTTPQKVAFESEDGAWREQEWSALDIRTARHVRVAPGTSTMMTRSAKAGVAQAELQLGAITLPEYQQIMNSGVSSIFGRMDNPHKQRVMRQIVAWKQGPAREVPPEQQAQQAAAIFAPIASDEDPAGAAIRYAELVRLQASTAYMKHPAPWRAAVDQALVMARRAAGMMTVAEQQQMQQQQAAAQQQQQQAQQQQQEQAEGAKAERQHAQTMERDAANADAKAATEQQRAEAQQAVAAMRQSMAGNA